MPKKPRARPSLADRFCEAIKELTAERQTRTYAAQWIMVRSVARHLGRSLPSPVAGYPLVAQARLDGERLWIHRLGSLIPALKDGVCARHKRISELARTIAGPITSPRSSERM
jgi:hypothetical protein